MSTFTSTTTGIVLSAVSQDPATIVSGATVTNTTGSHSGDGVYGSTAAAWNISNFGTVSATGTASSGIDLKAGGTLANAAGALISGVVNGIRITGASGTITNSGTIKQTGTVENNAIYLLNGGYINNLGFIGGTRAIFINHGGTIVNSGTIKSNGTGLDDAIYFSAGGAVINSNLITGTLGGVVIFNAVATVANSGTIKATGTELVSGLVSVGVRLGGGGNVINGQPSSATGLIQGHTGVEIDTTAATITNFGTIIGADDSIGAGIYLTAGGIINNQTGGIISGGSGAVIGAGGGSAVNFGAIAGIHRGFIVDAGGGTVINYGAITARDYVGPGKTAASGAIGSGVYLIGGGYFHNLGTINDTGTKTSGALVSSGGNFVNGQSDSTSGLIQGGINGVEIDGGAGDGINFGTIKGTGTASTGAYLSAGGTVVNNLSGLIAGVSRGVQIGNTSGSAGTVINYGTITGSGTNGIAVYLPGGGTVVNQGLLTGTDRGIKINSTSGTVINFGTVIATSNSGSGVNLNAGTVANSGTIIAAGGQSTAVAVFAGGITNYGTVVDTNGVGISVFGGLITNRGTIITGGASATAVIVRYGAFINQGVIIGAASGIQLALGIGAAGVGSVTLAGTVTGSIGISVAPGTTASQTVSVSGLVSGTSGTAVALTNGGSDRLILNTGAAFQGKVDGGNGKSVVEVAASAGTLTGGAGAGDAAATVYVNLGSVTNFSVLQMDSSAVVDAGGDLVFDTLVNQGRINLAAGDSLVIGTVAGAATGGTIDLKSGSMVHFTGAVVANQTVLFRPPGGSVVIDHPEQFAAAMTEFAADDIIDLPLGQASYQQYSGGVLNLSYNGGSVALQLSTLYAAPQFQFTGDNAGGTDILVSDAACFCRGTLIRTDRGEMAVEDLAVGDRVVTLSGAEKPIVWIGFGRDLVTRANKLARPVIVRRGALADDVPHRDLYLTHGHALYLESAIGGVLIPVENLINHRSIVWDETARVVEYYHIELADHDVVLAQGAPAETYYDAANRVRFHNTRPGSTAGGEKAPFAPVLSGGEVVERVWHQLFARAGGRVDCNTGEDPDLHLLVNGARLDAMQVEGGTYSFALDGPPAGTLRLCSHSGVPSLLGITRHDHRRLGVAIARIELRQPGLLSTVEPEAPLFVEGGCHPAEGGYCWTDGQFDLPAWLFVHLTGPFTLAVQIERPGMRYPIAAVRADAA